MYSHLTHSCEGKPALYHLEKHNSLCHSEDFCECVFARIQVDWTP